MQPIKVSEEQKEMLLEMCAILFPEYKNASLSLSPEYDGSEYYVFLDIYAIHWFELCITHLPVAMYRWAMHQKNIKPDEAFKIIQGNLTKLEDFDRCYINPIDFLYEKFKNIK